MARKPTSEELEQRAKELENEAVERKGAGERERQYIRELGFLSRRAMEFIQLPSEEDMYGLCFVLPCRWQRRGGQK